MFSRTFRGTHILLAGVLLLRTVAWAEAQDRDIRLWKARDDLYLSLVLPGSLQPDIISSLDSGLRSEITFEIKIYRTTRGFRSIFGDRLTQEILITREAKKDSFTGDYLLISPSETMTFSNPAEFLRRYFRLEEYPLPFTPAEGEEYYVLGRIIVEETKLVPPLNLLTPFMRDNRTATAWMRHPIPEEGENGV